MQRRRFKNVLSFPDRLDLEIERLRAEAEMLPQGAERNALLRKARQAGNCFPHERVAFVARPPAAPLKKCLC